VSDWRQDVDHQAVRDAVAFWWAHRHDPRPELSAAALVGYFPCWSRPYPNRLLNGRTGYVMQVLPGDQRLVQFGGEADGSVVVRLVADLDELVPL